MCIVSKIITFGHIHLQKEEIINISHSHHGHDRPGLEHGYDETHIDDFPCKVVPYYRSLVLYKTFVYKF